MVVMGMFLCLPERLPRMVKKINDYTVFRTIANVLEKDYFTHVFLATHIRQSGT
jgi:hypothetical protein